MKKRLTALAMTLVLCLSFLVIPAAAAETSVSGTYNAGVVTVTGSGFVENLRYSVIAVKDGSGNLIAFGGTTANASGELSTTITTGKIEDVAGYKVYVYNDNGGEIAAQGSVTLPAATMPTASFDAASMTLTISNFANTMTYSVNGGTAWIAAAATVDLSAATLTTASGIQVKNTAPGAADAIQTISLTQQAAPTGVGKTDETAQDANDGTLTGVSTAMEYRLVTTAAANWTAITDTSVTDLAPGSYEVRTKGAGTALASDTVTVTIAAFSTPVVTHTITASAGTGGSISPSGTVTVSNGASQTFVISANTNYSIADVKVDGTSVGAKSSHTFTNITADHTITATFTYNGSGGGGGGGGGGGDSGSSPSGGSTSGSGSNVSVSAGSTGSVSASTMNSAVSKATEGSTISVSAGSSAKATLPVSGMEKAADNRNSVSLALKNGEITLSAGAISGLVEGATSSASVSVGITAQSSSTNRDVQALISTGAPVFDVSVAVGTKAVHSFDGSLSITLKVSGLSKITDPRVAHFLTGGDVEYLTPTVSGNELTISGIRGLSSFAVIPASAVPKEEAPGALSFVDVSSGAYYYDAVAWAVENNVTSGTSATTFAPDASCTRAQVVTFLWRANGSPAASSSSRFADVDSGAYYADAVAWAVSQGITSGTGADTFSPDAVCTRAQVVTFLHRAEGSPAATGASFSDVDGGAYYADAVTWAVQNGVTAGTSASTFAPNATCTRAQVVTFLFRALAE